MIFNIYIYHQNGHGVWPCIFLVWETLEMYVLIINVEYDL